MRKRSLGPIVVFLVLFALLAPPSEAAPAYQWVDSSGLVHLVQHEYQVPEQIRRSGAYKRVGLPKPSETSVGPSQGRAALDALRPMRYLNPRAEGRPHGEFGFLEAAWRWPRHKLLRLPPSESDVVSSGDPVLQNLRDQISASEALIAQQNAKIARLVEAKRKIRRDYEAAVRRMRMSGTDILHNAREWNGAQDVKMRTKGLNQRIKDMENSIAEPQARISQLKAQLAMYEGMFLPPPWPSAILGLLIMTVVFLCKRAFTQREVLPPPNDYLADSPF
jgi:uncharacterized coiled-coil protein SlyX